MNRQIGNCLYQKDRRREFSCGLSMFFAASHAKGRANGSGIFFSHPFGFGFRQDSVLFSGLLHTGAAVWPMRPKFLILHGFNLFSLFDFTSRFYHKICKTGNTQKKEGRSS
jgi:hypothetical protein